jgi:predicted Zn-dependent peptidase
MAAGTVAPISPLTPALEKERPVVWPERTAARLSCGLRVVLVEQHRIPKLTMQLLFRSGNSATAASNPGLADMTATVARTGTATRTGQQIEEELRRLGADLSTGAGADSTAISMGGLAEFSREILTLLADLAMQANFAAEEFERERRNTLEAVRIERATPGFLAVERLRKVLFGAHPYAVVAPTEGQVEAYRREQLADFYRGHYTPENAVLIAVGEFSAADLIEQMDAAFRGWPVGQPPWQPEAAAPEIRGRRVYLVHVPGAVQTQILIGNRAITRKHPDWLPLTLANSIYGGAFHSRLVANIREQKGYTYSPRSTANALRQLGYFSVSAAVRNDVVAATLTEIIYELDRIRSLPVGGDELADALAYLSGIFSLGLATQSGLAGQLATVYLNELPEDYLEMYREKIRALTSDDVLTAARKYFDSANVQIVVVGDAARIAAQAALFGEVETYDAPGRRL